MKFAVSNIAWPTEADSAVADMLVENGITGIEIAPTKVWARPLEASEAAIASHRRFWESRGLTIIAAQALLFGRPDLVLFQDAPTRERTFAYLSGIVRVCGCVGAKSLVFGSPRNRRREKRSLDAVWPEAIDFFTRLGEQAWESQTCIALEANPPEYGADFITNTTQALELVRTVNHPGFRLHLDSACMTMAREEISTAIPAASHRQAHYHASEVNLAPLGMGSVEHARFARCLVEAGYRGWVSIEMRQSDPFDLSILREAVRFVRATYSPSSQE